MAASKKLFVNFMLMLLLVSVAFAEGEEGAAGESTTKKSAAYTISAWNIGITLLFALVSKFDKIFH